MLDDLVGVLLTIDIDNSNSPNVIGGKIRHSREPTGQVTDNIGQSESSPLLSVEMDPRLTDGPYILCRGRRNRVQITMKREPPDVGCFYDLKDRRSRRFCDLCM
jgi:hypothetical protein